MSDERCPSCGHDLTMHFASVAGTVRCLVTHTGRSTRGVIGEPYRYQCDCLDLKSAAAERDDDERREQEAVIEELRAAMASSPEVQSAHAAVRAALPAPNGDPK